MNNRDQLDSGEIRRTSLVMDVAIRCTIPGCSCDCFTPTTSHQRMCNSCSHGWVSHALDKLGFRHLYNCHQMELVQSCIVFDVASLILYGTQAIPIRLKILLDRLFSVLQHDEVLNVLQGFGWTYEDYVRGYILQDASGNVLEKWTLSTREEEPLILQQFLRFGETKAIAHRLLLQVDNDKPDQVVNLPKTDSDIRKFIERTNMVAGAAVLKQESSFTSSSAVSTSFPVVRTSRGRQLSSVSSTHSLSPSTGSPINCTSPLSISPLNKLQSMQPYDYRREKISPELRGGNEIPGLSRTTPLSSPTTSVPSASTALTNHTTTATINSDLSATDGGSEDDSKTAINLSQKGTYHFDSIYMAKKYKHLRKSANPMKRRWNPLVLSNLNTNPATGKKRVQCHVCLKTFCDKGALKIHFSAVHLREMHKCTVEGCSMMFSSRRSRNRHSANPNPKLHTPTFRRKFNPHDGRSANPYPNYSSSAFISLNNSVLSTSNTQDTDGDATRLQDSSQIPSCATISNEILVSSQSQISLSKPGEETGVLPLNKKHRPEENEKNSGHNNEGINLSMKENSPFVNTGVHKRKSLKPTRCAVTSDDEMQYVSTEETSSETFMDQGDENEDNDLLESKSEDGYSDTHDDFKDEEFYKDKIMKKDTTQDNFMQELAPSLPIKTTPKDNIQDIAVTTVEEPKHSELNRMYSEISENPLRHLESLSMSPFTNIVTTSTRSLASKSLSTSGGISFHAPGLGLAAPMVPEKIFNQNNTTLQIPSASSINTTLGSQGQTFIDQDSNPDSEQHFPLLTGYRDSGSLDIPVDKENPRRCIACGKIFQNHFGVKTHYQNVHLKLMHKCTVEGCNAAFPSKRSRDRHSANLNLHRKLLSTSSDKVSPFLEKNSIYPYHASVLRDDFFSRMYDPQALPLNFADLYPGRIPTCGPESLITNPAFAVGSLSHVLPFHPAFMPPTNSTALSEGITGILGINGRNTSPSPLVTSPDRQTKPKSPKSNHQRNSSSVTLDEELLPDAEGQYICEFCQRKFQDSISIKEHYENNHVEKLLLCTVDNCGKAFLTKKARNCHTHEDSVLNVVRTISTIPVS
ncbi:zinc finger protein basonuclin-2-like isoform X1 [Limulus polyphemus]|uniref:Zinc finger protein basonuclin-2-like isoform X1 n=3 Tax=Limulus polyphemus TaxID=6850 RepID=A0ABM1SEM9_LIMPO|nr:zinc finger protein basonuclin-2-like isoform X1 [Limulus polyphemus]